MHEIAERMVGWTLRKTTLEWTSSNGALGKGRNTNFLPHWEIMVEIKGQGTWQIVVGFEEAQARDEQAKASSESSEGNRVV